jgi:hypothetical protein
MRTDAVAEISLRFDFSVVGSEQDRLGGWLWSATLGRRLWLPTAWAQRDKLIMPCVRVRVPAAARAAGSGSTGTSQRTQAPLQPVIMMP